jgi:hypothetical protein
VFIGKAESAKVRVRGRVVGPQHRSCRYGKRGLVNVGIGDDSDSWTGYGGVDPVILQFTDAAQVAEQTVDADAYIGTAEELQQMLTTGDDMTPEQAQHFSRSGFSCLARPVRAGHS